MLEAAEGDIEIKDGEVMVKGTDKKLLWHEICLGAYTAHNLPEDMESGLKEGAFYDPSNFAYSNGGHVVEIEIDTETGVIELQRYHVVDDIGTVINPMIVHAQIHGGLAQGIGQAIIENGYYDPDSGQLIAGSFMDYGLLRADEVPNFNTGLHEVPTANNPLGVKGGGEGATVSATAAFINAVCDALRDYGVRDIEMPATPERLWQAMRKSAGSGQAA